MQIDQKIDVENSINSGQVFLWRKNNNCWYGINGQDILRVEKNGKVHSYQNLRVNFFRKQDNMDEIIKSISKDKIIKKAIKKYSGLRIFQQDPFQCLISFIISSNSNIQKIKTNLEAISKKFGAKVTFENQKFFLFPKPEELAKATINELRNCGIGYRAKFVKEATNMVFSKKNKF